jgi:hypothetical protein
VAECLNLSKAAQELLIAQPPEPALVNLHSPARAENGLSAIVDACYVMHRWLSSDANRAAATCWLNLFLSAVRWRSSRLQKIVTTIGQSDVRLPALPPQKSVADEIQSAQT